MKQIMTALATVLALSACKPKPELPKEWVLIQSTTLEGVNPIGIAQVDGQLWLSDGDHNRMVKLNDIGQITATIDSLDRPMHIDAFEGVLFVPQYGSDNITTFSNGIRGIMAMKDSLDAPAGIAVLGKERAIADFYNNRILYFNGGDWISFGKEGKGNGEFYYPTDVQITAENIWVADAYNNRVQVFDKRGNFIKMMGQDQKMNAATGIYVSESEVFVTDFENNRVLVMDLDGRLKQVLKESVQKPTDILIMNGTLYVINYPTGTLNSYELQEVKTEMRS
ncbi:MAG: NHL repeat-containing protein [Flavobacteriaceae bacterium]